MESPIPDSKGRLMFRIVRFPQKLTRFFAPVEGLFHWDHFEYSRNLVLLIAFAHGRRNISNLYRHFDAERHRTRHNHFVQVDRWDPQAALCQTAREMLASLQPRCGERMFFLVDDSKHRKCGKHMEAVAWSSGTAPLCTKPSSGALTQSSSRAWARRTWLPTPSTASRPASATTRFIMAPRLTGRRMMDSWELQRPVAMLACIVACSHPACQLHNGWPGGCLVAA